MALFTGGLARSTAPGSCGNGSGAIPIISPGTCARAKRRAAPRRTRCNGGSIFAEAPEFTAPEARIIWDAELDPGTLSVSATPTGASDPDGIRIRDLAPWLTIATDPDGYEHCVLSDGWRHIRLDVDAGRLTGADNVLLYYHLFGQASAEKRLLPLRRFLYLCRHRRFARTLFPRDAAIPRLLTMLRVHDALADGASQSDIGAALFGRDRVTRDWHAGSGSLRSRVRRLVREARAMAAGGYRQLLRKRQ